MTFGDDENRLRPTDVGRRELLQGAGGALVGLGAATSVAGATEPTVEYLSCTSVRIEGSVEHVELHTGYFVTGDGGGFATDVKEFGPVAGTTVISADDIYPDGREFYVSSVSLFDESFNGANSLSFDNPDGSECLDALTQPTPTPTLKHNFYGCSQVCVNKTGVTAVVSTGSGFVCRSISRASDRNDPPVRDWSKVRCRSVGGREAIVGICHGGSFTRNPNRCADNYLSDGFDCGDC